MSSPEEVFRVDLSEFAAFLRAYADRYGDRPIGPNMVAGLLEQARRGKSATIAIDAERIDQFAADGFVELRTISALEASLNFNITPLAWCIDCHRQVGTFNESLQGGCPDHPTLLPTYVVAIAQWDEITGLVSLEKVGSPDPYRWVDALDGLDEGDHDL